MAFALVACGGGSPVDDERLLPQAGTASASAPVHRFAKISNGAYFFTGDEVEKDLILRSYPDFRYEGVAFLRMTVSGGQPVYRFANLGNGGYFYTASEVERDIVRNTRADLRYEGSTFSVALQGSAGAAPVYRLANLRNGAYLYTVSTAEVAGAAQTGIWREEGLSFHALPVSADLQATALGCFNPVLYQPGTNYSTLHNDGAGNFTRAVGSATSFGGQSVIPITETVGGVSAKNYYAVGGGDVALKGTEVTVSGVAATVTLMPAAPVAFFSLPPGGTVSRQGNISLSARGQSQSVAFTATMSFAGFEDVSAPAGTFAGTCKFTSVMNAPGYTTESATIWYARGSGVVVKRISSTSGTASLVSASINGAGVRP